MKYHQSLTPEKWKAMTLDRRMLNIASDLSRAKSWMGRGDNRLVNESIERAMELTDLTIETGFEGQSTHLRREFLRFREAVAQCYISEPKDKEEFGILLKAFLNLNPQVSNLNLVM
jgi:hypothetical protein